MRWIIPERDRDKESLLVKELGISPVVAAILVQRGFTNPQDAHSFLYPSLDHMHDPSLLPDYEAAVKCILAAKESGDLIFVHGDYDVDGITSAALFNRFLSTIGCNVITHVPHRMKEGYGIHSSAVEAAKAAGAKLFLTCDCGTSAYEQVKEAKAAGMKVVVTDHHTVGKELPEADAVVNPHRPDSKYPFEELSGVGVAFKLCEGITSELGFKKEHFWKAYLDLAALGTIADVMPLQDENRLIAKFGLERLSATKKAGLVALKREAKALGPLRAYHVGFVLGPRLNAAGRIDDAAMALELLLANDKDEAGKIARKIETVNDARRSEQERILEEAIERVLESSLHEKPIIVIGNEGWHPGIIGIVAGRLVEKFMRPTFVLSIDTERGICKGSARTIPGFHLADAIRANNELFINGGGHAMAAGCTFALDQFDAVTAGLETYASSVLTAEDFIPSLEVDLEVMPEDVTAETITQISQMEPFGCGNPEPVLLSRAMTFAKIIPTRNPEHVKVSLATQAGQQIDSVAFGHGEKLMEMQAGFEADILFRATFNDFRGNRKIEWQIKDYYV